MAHGAGRHVQTVRELGFVPTIAPFRICAGRAAQPPHNPQSLVVAGHDELHDSNCILTARRV